MSRVPACEDAAAISARLTELREEKLAVFKCSCEPAIGSKGEIIRIASLACPIHAPKTVDAEWGGCG